LKQTIDSALEEIAEGLKTPKVGSFLYGLIEDSIQEIFELKDDDAIPCFVRDYQIAELRSQVYNSLAGYRFKNSTPSDLRKWYPRGSSDLGFLAWGESLDRTIAKDALTLVELNVSAEALGLKLKEVLSSNGSASFAVEMQSWRGFQECPFDTCSQMGMYVHSCVDFTLVNKQTGEGVMGPGLIWHLIAEHGFFEGERSAYRVDPRRLTTVLFG
jgi:hypothetical protein